MKFSLFLSRYQIRRVCQSPLLSRPASTRLHLLLSSLFSFPSLLSGGAARSYDAGSQLLPGQPRAKKFPPKLCFAATARRRAGSAGCRSLFIFFLLFPTSGVAFIILPSPLVTKFFFIFLGRNEKKKILPLLACKAIRTTAARACVRRPPSWLRRRPAWPALAGARTIRSP